MKLFYQIHTYSIHKPGASKSLLDKLAKAYGWGNVIYRDHQPTVEKGYISISHSQSFWMCVHNDNPIGIDIEVKRSLSEVLIKRFKLNAQNPLQDWCEREAYFKLSQDNTAFFHPIPLTLAVHTIDHEDLCIVVVSHERITELEWIELSETL